MYYLLCPPSHRAIFNLPLPCVALNQCHRAIFNLLQTQCYVDLAIFNLSQPKFNVDLAIFNLPQTQCYVVSVSNDEYSNSKALWWVWLLMGMILARASLFTLCIGIKQCLMEIFHIAEISWCQLFKYFFERFKIFISVSMDMKNMTRHLRKSKKEGLSNELSSTYPISYSSLLNFFFFF